MAVWFPASQLLLIALLSWNVLCFPAKSVSPHSPWSRSDPNQSDFSSTNVSPELYSSSQSAPPAASAVNQPAASYLYEPEKKDYSISETYPWNAGELKNYEQSFEHGNSEMETEELNLLPPPPPPRGPYLGSPFQAGELSNYEVISEHGNEERETEEQGFMPHYESPAPWVVKELSPASRGEGPAMHISHELGPGGPNMYYYFLTGQLPPGTFSHFQSDYETGGDHWDEVGYERYYYPTAQQPTIPTQTQEAFSDGWQQPQNYFKA